MRRRAAALRLSCDCSPTVCTKGNCGSVNGEVIPVCSNQTIPYPERTTSESPIRQAASGVQQKFTLPQFEAMIRPDYSEMTSAQRIEFGLVKVSGSAAVVQVFFCGAGGSVRSKGS